MDLRWDDLKYFLFVYEQGSMSAAARVLKLGQPTLSRRIAELEEVVGEALFERTSQGSVLTAVGHRLLPAAQRMAEWATEAATHVQTENSRPQGNVRIAAPPGIAHEVLVPLAIKIRREYPQVFLSILSGIEMLNLSRGEADLSLRTLRPIDEDLVCLYEMNTPLKVYASDALIAQVHANPQLTDLPWIGWAAPYHELWVNQELRARIPNFKPVFASDDFQVQLAACEAGLGAMVLPQSLYRYGCKHRSLQLRELEIDLGEDAIGELFLVCHKRHRHLPKVRVVIDSLSEMFKDFQLSC